MTETFADKLTFTWMLEHFLAACIMFNAVFMWSVVFDEFLVTEIGYCLVHY